MNALTRGPWKRHTSSSPCPVCQGHDRLPRGQGIRCSGGRSPDGRLISCSREDRAGGLRSSGDRLYVHAANGRCRCGVEHAPDLDVVHWEIRDHNGRVQAVHCRRDLPGGGKTYWWERCGAMGLGGIPEATLPLYGSELVREWPADAPVLLVEGEKDCTALLNHGIRAVANVLGAPKVHDKTVYKVVLGGRSVILWPDNDGVGREQMAASIPLLEAAEARITVFEWDTAPTKGGAHDYFAVGGTVASLCSDLERAVPAKDWLQARASRQPPSTIEKDSAALRDEVPAEKVLRFQTAAEMCATTPEEVPWIIHGYVPRGGLVELDGKVKSGKTTLIARLVREVLDGGTFLGKPVTQGRVVWLTEQPTTSFADALRFAGLEDRHDLVLLQWHDTRGISWEDVVEAARAKVAEMEAVLLVVDTLGQFAGLHGDAENSAGDAQRALRPLQMATADGLGVLVARHERKSGGEIGDSARGSSAFTGAADVVMVLRRPEGNQRDTVRVLSAIGRFRETPAEQVIELQDGAYVSLGTALDVAASEARKRVLEECPHEATNALRLTELVDRLKIKRTTAQAAVDALVKERLLARTGRGKRGDPWRYYAPEEFLSEPPPTDTGSGRRESAPLESIPPDPPGAPAETNLTPDSDRGAKPPSPSSSLPAKEGEGLVAEVIAEGCAS